MSDPTETSHPDDAAPLAMAEWLRERGETAAAGMIVTMVEKMQALRRDLSQADEVVYYKHAFYPYAFPDRLDLALSNALERHAKEVPAHG